MTPPIIETPSPNHDHRPAGTPIDHLVLHYTGMPIGQAALDRLRDPAPPTGIPVSSHYVVEEDGRVFRLVPEHRRAWHAGVSHWRGHDTLNARSIGIEVVNPGHDWGYQPFPAAQIQAVTTLCQAILAQHPIPQMNVVAHSDIAPDRKQDPGELFPWPALAAAGVGLWTLGRLAPLDEHEVEPALRVIGYPVPGLATTLRAFQRRWLPDHLSATPDAPTRSRLAAIRDLYRRAAHPAP